MSTLYELAEQYTQLPNAAVDYLQRLVVEWQMLSDMAFADLLLWVAGDDESFICLAHCRPTTSATIYPQDQVGKIATGAAVAHLYPAVSEQRMLRVDGVLLNDDLPVRREAIPVRYEDSIIAVVGRDMNLLPMRMFGALELNYQRAADDVCRMIADGRFPVKIRPGGTTAVPRVGDGVIRLDATGHVVYASPNAVSAYRRLGHTGDLMGQHLGRLSGQLANDSLTGGDVAGLLINSVNGSEMVRTEVEGRGGVTILCQLLPLYPDGKHVGALVLARDITELRRRDRQLLTKDTMIREIHHRVKNNLQTVAALLRMQARRVNSAPAQRALEESVQRVAAIALVHETLSRSLDADVKFDDIVDQVIVMLADVAVAPEQVQVIREGSFGVVSADIATSLVMCITELVQNAIEHAYSDGSSGQVVVAAHRWRGNLYARVIDSGIGLPQDFNPDSSSRLGLRIVQTLILDDLQGSVSFETHSPQGTEVVITVPLVSSGR